MIEQSETNLFFNCFPFVILLALVFGCSLMGLFRFVLYHIYKKKRKEERCIEVNVEMEGSGKAATNTQTEKWWNIELKQMLTTISENFPKKKRSNMWICLIFIFDCVKVDVTNTQFEREMNKLKDKQMEREIRWNGEIVHIHLRHTTHTNTLEREKNT